MKNPAPSTYRLIVIDREIRSARYPNVPGLATLLDVSMRTVQRDLEYLRDVMEAPLEWSVPENGYRYSEPGYVLPVRKVGEGDLLALLLSDRAITEYRGTPFETELRRILQKLGSALPQEIPISSEALAGACTQPSSGRRDGGLLPALDQAIRESATLEVLYHTQSRDVTQWRKLNPYHLALVDGEWYLFAHCHLNREVRVFLPSHIRGCRRTGDSFTPPRAFDTVHFLKAHSQLLPGKSPIAVKIRIDQAHAPDLGEKDSSAALKVQYLTNGGVDLTVSAEDVDAVIRWTLNWGSGAEILSPPWVRRRARDLLRRLTERYATAAARSRDPQGLARKTQRVYKPPSRRSGA
jgi:proteasome accessory factor B